MSLPQLRSGDTITVTRLDRLFHSVQNLIIVATELRDRGIRLHAVEQGTGSNTLDGRDFFGMMSAFANPHCEFVLAATNDGPAAARVRGKTGGRLPRRRENGSVERSGCARLPTGALREDQHAVARRISTTYNSGVNEGRITDVEPQKHLMAGRAGAPLPRHLVVRIAHLRHSCADRPTTAPG
ncbi:recombinase family protein [Streptomyces acidicola]|uniref:recombinase family protein n=1 Tax=Streptomyces acidicola TaxID=2596892 RepID=UPI00378E7704